MKTNELKISYCIPKTNVDNPEILEGESLVYEVANVPFQASHPISGEMMMNVATFLLIAIDKELKFVPANFCKIIKNFTKININGKNYEV